MNNRRSLSRTLPGLGVRRQQPATVQLGAARLGAAAVGAAALASVPSAPWPWPTKAEPILDGI
jgi:hypothetical protein